jgi:hypothetical protein
VSGHALFTNGLPGRGLEAAVTRTREPGAVSLARSMILPLALAQFVASYAATNMNVAISAIAKDLGTNVIGVQTAITLFTLTMASSFGTALVGSVLVAANLPAGKLFAAAMTVLAVITLIGLGLAVLIPRQPGASAIASVPVQTGQRS